MRRILGLWLLLLVIELAAFITIGGVALHQVNLRFDAFLATLVAPAVQAMLLVAFVPALRDRVAASPREALQGRGVMPAAGVALTVILLVAAASVLRLGPGQSFDYARGGLLVAAAIAFALARRYAATTLFAILGLLSGHFERISEQVFPTQPILFRWLVFFIPLTLVVVIALLTITSSRGTRHAGLASANALLEYSLAPAAGAIGIIVSEYYLRPFIPPTALLLANILGLTAAGIVLLSGVAAAARRP